MEFRWDSPAKRLRCDIFVESQIKFAKAPFRSGIIWKRTEYVAPPGLGILRESSGYKDSAPDGAEDAPQ
jgi:hypothetical protein